MNLDEKDPTLMNKRIVFVFGIMALAGVIGLRLTFLSAHASPSYAAKAQDSTAASDPAPPTLEHKILVFGSWASSRKSLGYGPIGPAPPNLEDEINKLAEQGFVVESVQTSSQGDGWGSLSTFSEIVVLLKRAKK